MCTRGPGFPFSGMPPKHSFSGEEEKKDNNVLRLDVPTFS